MSPVASALLVPELALAAAILLSAARRIALAVAAVALYRVPDAAPAAATGPFLVVCACRNEADHLAGLLDSLEAQSYPPDRVRVVVVDDASTDGSGVVLRRAVARHPNWSLVSFPRREGKVRAVLAALEAAPEREGELVLVMDSDHHAAPDLLERLAARLADPGVAAVAPQHVVRNPTDSLLSWYCCLESMVTDQVISRGQTGLGLNPKLGGTWCVRGDALRRSYAGVSEFADDADLSARLMAGGGRIVYAAEAVSTHLVRAGVNGYLEQHLRWAGGMYLASGRNVRAVLRGQSKTGWAAALDAAVMMLGHIERPLLLLLLLTNLPLTALGVPAAPALVAAGAWAASVAVQVGTALALARAAPVRWLTAVPALAFGGGLDIGVGAAAFVTAVAGRAIVFRSSRYAD